MSEVELKRPVHDGFWGGVGFISACLVTALIFMVLYLFYLAFLV